MSWFWRQVSQYLRAHTVVELHGITEDALLSALHGEAMRRLDCIGQIIFSEEMTDKEKVLMIQKKFLEE